MVEGSRQLSIFNVLLISFIGFSHGSSVVQVNGELDATISFSCEIDRLASNGIITWVYRPKNYKINGIRWLPLYANARRLTQNNPRFIVDYTGYNDQTKKSLSILTLHDIQATDEGVYMCKSNQYQSVSNLFNLTVLPSIKILPNKENLILDQLPSTLNLSCFVREVSSQMINPKSLKWFKNDKELDSIYIIEQSSDWNQVKSIVEIPSWLFKDADQVHCIYENGKMKKNLRISSNKNSMLGYSKSIATKQCLPFDWIVCIFFLRTINDHFL